MKKLIFVIIFFITGLLFSQMVVYQYPPTRVFSTGGGTPWSPTNLTLAAWFDASDTNTITQAGGLISQWDDKSTNAYHATQATGSKQPTTNTLNSLPATSWDGSDIMYSSLSASSSEETSMFVMNIPTLENETFVGANTDGGRNVRSRGIAKMQFLRQFVVSLAEATNTITADVPFISELTYNSSTSIFYLTGNPGGSTNINPNLTGGRTTTFGGVGSGGEGNFFSGTIGEMVFCQSVLSTSDRQKLEGYLAWKWGLVAKLPLDHPYRWDGSLFGYGVLWTPDDMTTIAWYDASDTNTITESAGSVSQWDDKSGNNNDAVQGTGSSQPATGVTNINSLNALKFDSDYMVLSTGLTTVRAVFFVTDGVQGSVGDSVWAPMFGEDSYPGSYTMLRCVDDSAYDISIDGAVSDTGNAGISGNTPVSGGNITLVPASSIAERLNNPYQWYVDWTASTTVDWLGALKPSGASWTARTVFGEFILLSSVPSTSDRQKLEGYLAWKWGLEDELPAGHPYKDSAPTQ